MKVWVLMADCGYDGDALLGVYESEYAAHSAGADWKPAHSFEVDYFPYVVPVEVGSHAELRETFHERPTSSS